MNNKERTAMQQALEALEELHYSSGTVVAARMYESATAALQAALAEQAEQEPVAWIDNETWCFTYSQYEYEDLDDDMKDDLVPLYAAPVRTKDLTDDDLQPFLDEWWSLPCDTAHDVKKIFRAVIAADREKNK